MSHRLDPHVIVAALLLALVGFIIGAALHAAM